MTKDEALKMAQEVLNLYCGQLNSTFANDALKAINEALEQPAQEPVGYTAPWCIEYVAEYHIHEHTPTAEFWYKKGSSNEVALYTNPHQWQGLTDNEIDKIFEDIIAGCYGDDGFYIKFTHAIEQALKEKNT